MANFYCEAISAVHTVCTISHIFSQADSMRITLLLMQILGAKSSLHLLMKTKFVMLGIRTLPVQPILPGGGLVGGRGPLRPAPRRKILLPLMVVILSAPEARYRKDLSLL